MKGKLFYGWIVVGVAVAAVLLSAGVRSAPGVFLVPMLSDADIALSRPVISAAIALGLVFYGAAAPVSGWLMDRFGPRCMMMVSMLLVAASMVFSARLRSEFELTWFLGADTFGRQNVRTVYGWVFCAHQIGAASAAWLGGVARSALGDYGPAFFVAGVIGITAALMALMISKSGPQLTLNST